MTFIFGVLVGAAIVSIIWTLTEDHKMDKYLTRLEQMQRRARK